MRPDARGVEGLPLRLLIAAAVLLLVLPMVASALSVHDLHRTEDRVRGEAARALALAGHLALAGGGRGHLTLDLRGSALTAIVSFRFAAAGTTGVALYRLSGLEERSVSLPDLPARLSFGTTADLSLASGFVDLVLEYRAGAVAVMRA